MENKEPTVENDATDIRCTSQSEDGRRCHGDVGHPGTHWAGASRIWSDTETLVRPGRLAGRPSITEEQARQLIERADPPTRILPPGGQQ